MIEAFDPPGYPGPRAGGPVLVHGGRLHPLVVDGPDAPLALAEPGTAGFVLPEMPGSASWRWSLAYGSNASPGRLVAKGLDRDGAVLLPARIRDVAPVYEHRRTGYGAVPLTLVTAPGHLLETWVLGVPPASTVALDRTEGRVADGAPAGPSTPERDDGLVAPPGTYQLARVGEVAVADRFRLADALAYLPGPGTRLQRTEHGDWRTWPASSQADAGVHADTSGPSGPAPAVEAPVLGPWPATPITDLPLFVYGTLAPGAVAWPSIADLVEVVGPATARGALYDTGQGWPAARFVSGMDRAPTTEEVTVHGVLLAASGPAEARELFGRSDRYEGVPEPYRRVAIEVTSHLPDRADASSRWAVAYTWSADTAPGPRIRGGKWVVR